MSTNRNRSEGWQHAKRTGHANEKLIAEITRQNPLIQQRLLQAAHKTGCTIQSIEYGGLCETDVDSVLGGKTKSKTDMWLELSDGTRLNVSIKKDTGGQVFLIGIDRFIQGFEAQYHQVIDSSVKRALSLYFGSAEDTLEIINRFGNPATKALEHRKHRLVGNTLKEYNSQLYGELLQWFNTHIAHLFDFCFAKGLALHSQDWAHLVWYKNMVGENAFDTLIYLPDMSARISPTAEYGTKNGGSTIQLPFGFVQWHSPRKIIPGSMQFHHNYFRLLELLR